MRQVLGRHQHQAKAQIGCWRLLAPALLCWAAAAALVHADGAARVAGIAAITTACGASAWMLRAPGVRRIAATCLLWSALLLVLCTRIDAGERTRNSHGSGIEASLEASESVTATLTGFPRTTAGPNGSDRGWVRATVEGVPVMLWLPEVADERWGPGTLVEFSGRATKTAPESLVAYEVRVRAIRAAEIAAHPVRRVFSEVPAALRTSLTMAASTQAGAQLVPGFAVGDTSLVDEELHALMKETSLTHIVAVSGANCALLTGAVIWVASRCGIGRRGRQIVAGLALGGFVLVVGPDPSVQRAGIMAAVVLASKFGGRQAQSLPALGLAVFVLLMIDPWQSLAPGFALSVVATAGILVWAAPVQSWLRVRLRFPKYLAAAVGIASVAQVACAPVLLLLQPGLSAAGILANILAAPAAPIGTGLGLIAMILLQVNPALGAGVVWLASWPARWVVASGEVALALPGGRWNWPGGWGGALLLAGVTASLLVVWALATGRLSGPGAAHVQPVGITPWAPPTKLPRRTRLLVQAFAGVAAGVVVGVVVVVPASVRVGVPSDWNLVACDVGQGDALLIRDTRVPDEVMLVDVGDDPQALGECLDLFGVRRVALLVLTHDDRDHVGAVAGILPRTDAAMIAAPTREQASRRPLTETLTRAGVPFVVGDVGMASASGLAWEILSPPANVTPTRTNAASLVLRVVVDGVVMLFLGDTGEDEQCALRIRYPDLRADIVKVAHHGSRDQCAELYRDLGSQLALVSVGAQNRYGHPNAELLQSLEASGATSLRTDELGAIALSVRGGRVEAWASG